jgi:hypothetical protein
MGKWNLFPLSPFSPIQIMGGFGLTMGINADPSQAQAAIKGLQEQASEGFTSIGEAANTGGEDPSIKVVDFDLGQANTQLQQLPSQLNQAAASLAVFDAQFRRIGSEMPQWTSDLQTILQTLGQWNIATQQVTEAQRLEAAALDLLKGKYAQEIAGIVEMIAGKRAAAAVLAVWNAARAAEAFPDFEAMAQYTLASIKYALVAGGVGGAAGGSAARGGGRGGQTGSPGVSPGALAPGSAPAPGGQVTVMVMGEPTAAAWLATNVLNPYVQRGGTLNASTAQRVPASGG